MKLLLACALLAGCGKKEDAPKPPPPKPADAPPSPACVKAVAPYLDRMYGILAQSPAAKAGGADAIAATRAKLEPALVAECTASKWPDTYLACITAPKSGEEMEACEHRLPADARARGGRLVDSILEPVVTKYTPKEAPAPANEADEEKP